MDNPKILATRSALRKMFKDQSYFDICTIDNLVKMNGTLIDGEVYSIMRTMHCVHYTTMEPGLAQWLLDETIKAFGGPALDLSGIEVMRPDRFTIQVSPAPEKRGILRKLLGS